MSEVNVSVKYDSLEPGYVRYEDIVAGSLEDAIKEAYERTRVGEFVKSISFDVTIGENLWNFIGRPE